MCVHSYTSRFFSLEQEKAYHFRDMHMAHNNTSKLTNYNVEYRDGIKSNGDKIGMP